MVPLKYLSNSWRTLEKTLINCEINLMLTWSVKCVTSSNAVTDQETKFAITDTKRYVPVVTLSTQGNEKLLQQLKSGFKHTFIWSKYQSRVSTPTRNPYLDYLVDPSFQGVNRLFVSSFENNVHRKSHKRHFPLTIEIKGYNMIDRRNFFNQPVKTYKRT